MAEDTNIVAQVKENVEKKKVKPIHIAFDSDVISNLAIMYSQEQNGGFDVTKCHDKYIVNNYNLLNCVYGQIMGGFIKPVITNTIFHEVAAFQINVDFIRKFGRFPDYTSADVKSKAKEIKQLAKAYCNEYEDGYGVHAAPMDPVYSAHSGIWVPSNDAYAMAEASVENLLFVTCNEKDYIMNAYDTKLLRQLKEEDRLNETKIPGSRATGIRTINKQMGYGNGEGRYSPGPIAFKVFAKRLMAMGKNYETLEPKYELKKLFKVMDSGELDLHGTVAIDAKTRNAKGESIDKETMGEE